MFVLHLLYRVLVAEILRVSDLFQGQFHQVEACRKQEDSRVMHREDGKKVNELGHKFSEVWGYRAFLA